MSVFNEQLTRLNVGMEAPDGRRWVFVPYDQLTDAVGPLAAMPARELGIVVVETLWKPRRRAYHKQKLALVIASLRHFALEQARRGVAVLHVTGETSYAALLEPVAQERGPLVMMEAAERELREDLRPLVESGLLSIVPNETWLTTHDQFEATFSGDRAWRMDRFYREARKASGILMEKGKPIGGKYSFDAENRKRWPGEPAAPKPPQFLEDAIKSEVVEFVEDAFADHPGRLDVEQLPATQKDAETLWAWALEHCLPLFGPYEDAMSTASASLFHTRTSALMNNGRLLPRRIIGDVLALDIPLASQEGFIRQVFGWREFMRHVHLATDGFRSLAPDAQPNFFDAREPLPPAFWGEPSGLRCLDHVVEEVWDTGYGHHITRLMVLSNLATLLGLDPRAVTDWFWVAYVDAYDWVVEPNVLGMGTFALGDLFVTKPYVSGAAYIHRMSDYCKGCAFTPNKDCPITPLYWNFFDRHADALAGNPRVSMPLRNVAKRSPEQKSHDRAVYAWAVETLRAGEPLKPEDQP